MSQKSTSRRDFVSTTIKAGAAISAVSGFTAKSYARVPGANERIRVGLIGCGGRGSWHIGWLQRTAEAGQNVEVVAGCDIWNERRRRAAEIIQERFEFESEPTTYKDHEDLLARDDIHAVVIATADHQHCTHLRDAVNAGKDAYVEKPIALELDDLNKTIDVVKASDRIVQFGTQGRSSKGALAAKKFIQEGGLGKIIRVEESRSAYNPYWNFYKNPEKESDTDWKRFLMHLPYRPFDADMHGAWMGYLGCSNRYCGGLDESYERFCSFPDGC